MPSSEGLRAVVVLNGRTIATSAVEHLALTPTPSLDPPAPTPTPYIDPPPPAPTPTPSLYPTPTPTPVLRRSYDITYQGTSVYDFGRKNVTSIGGTTLTDTYNHRSTLSWSTSYAPIVLGPAATDTVSVDQAHVLSGSASSTKDSEGAGAGYDIHDSCTGTAPDDLGDLATAYAPPHVAASPNPVGTGVEVTVQAGQSHGVRGDPVRRGPGEAHLDRPRRGPDPPRR